MDQKATSLLQIFTLACLPMAVLCWGAVHPLTTIIMSAILGIILIIALHYDFHWHIPKPLLYGWLLLSAVTIFQVLPFPANIAGLLSPHSSDILAFLLKEPSGDKITWLPLVFTPGETLFSLGRLSLAFIYLLILVALFSHHTQRRLWPLWLLSGLGAVSTIFSLIFSIITPGLIKSFYPNGAISDTLFPASFINSNFQASFYLLSTFGALALSVHNSIDKNFRKLAVSMAICSLLGIFLTASRGAILISTGGLLLLGIINRKHFGKKGLALILLAITSGLALTFLLSSGHLQTQLATLYPDRFSFQQEKSAYWPIIGKIVKDYWLLGIGSEGLAAIAPQYGISFGARLAAAETILLDMALKFGLPATILLLFLGGWLLSQFIRQRELHSTEWTLICGLGCWLFHNFVDFNWRSPAILMAVGIFLAMLITARHRHKSAHWFQIHHWQGYSMAIFLLIWIIPAIFAKSAVPRQYDQKFRQFAADNPQQLTVLFKQTAYWAPADSYRYTLYSWAKAHEDKKESAIEALHYANRALFLEPDSWMAAFSSALALNKLGRFEQAKLQLLTALNNANNAQLKLLLPQIWNHGRGQKLLLQLGGEANYDIKTAILVMLLQNGSHEQLAEAANHFNFIATAETAAQLQLAYRLAKTINNTDWMNSACGKINKIYPDHYYAHCCSAELLATAGQLAAARERLEPTLNNCQQQACREILDSLSKIYYLDNDIKALSQLMTKPEAATLLDELYNKRGQLYDKNGHSREAIIDYQRAITINPSSSAWYSLGRRFELDDHPIQAINAYKKMIEYHPEHQPSQKALLRLNNNH